MATAPSTINAADLYKCGPEQTKEFIIEVLQAGLVPYVRSSPGMGKSSIIRQIAKEWNLELIDIRLSTCAPEDLTGLPRLTDNSAKFVPFTDLFPIEGMELPEGKDGWFIFLDEFNAGERQIQAASYKIVLDRMVGQYKLHEKVVLAMAGNLDTDKAITNRISTAMQSRVIHLFMETSHDDWMKLVGAPHKYDTRILAYLGWKPGALNEFDPEHTDNTFNCQRTWEFVNALIKGKTFGRSKDSNGLWEYEIDKKIPLFAGTIGAGTAVDFVQFTKVFHDLPSINDILRDPNNAKVPDDLNAKWAMVTTILEHLEEKTYVPLFAYVDRYDVSLKIMFYRAALVQIPTLRSHAAFAKQMIDLGRYLS